GLVGEMCRTRVAGYFGAGENMSRSIAARDAASVLPEPVGARTRTLSPSAIAGQASSCARVGVWNVASNHARVAGLNVGSGSLPTSPMLRAAQLSRIVVRTTKGPAKAGPFVLNSRLVRLALVDLDVASDQRPACGVANREFLDAEHVRSTPRR